MKKYIAEVIDNNPKDSNGNYLEEGSIQIYVAFLHHDIPKNLLPLAKQDRSATSFIPEKGEMVWVWFADEDYFKKPFYCNKVNLKKLHEHGIDDQLDMDSKYPDVKYIKLKNGIIVALSSNNDTPEILINHPKVYLYIDKDGYLHYKDENDNRIKIFNDGMIIKDSKGNEIKTDGTKWVINNHLTIEQ